MIVAWALTGAAPAAMASDSTVTGSRRRRANFALGIEMHRLNI
jgi:hypothetical protein